jgi:hypothetical protein
VRRSSSNDSAENNGFFEYTESLLVSHTAGRHAFTPFNNWSSAMIDKPQGRRQFGRRQAFKAATIVHADGQRLPATVIDLSEGGARIRVAQPEVVEKEFYLEIPGDDFIVKCRVIHIQEASVGAAFIRPPRRLSWLNK